MLNQNFVQLTEKGGNAFTLVVLFLKTTKHSSNFWGQMWTIENRVTWM